MERNFSFPQSVFRQSRFFEYLFAHGMFYAIIQLEELLIFLGFSVRFKYDIEKRNS